MTSARSRLAFHRPFTFLIIVQTILLLADAILDRNGSNTLITALIMGFFVWAVTAALASVHIRVSYLKTVGTSAVILRILEFYTQRQIVSILLYLSWGAFCLLIICSLIKFTLRTDEAAIASKLAAVAATYIAFPQFWNCVFLLIQTADGSAFTIGSHTQQITYQNMLYFSYNVFTTTAATNILPVAPVASAAVVLSEISAQLFVVIFIARIVSFFPTLRHPRDTAK